MVYSIELKFCNRIIGHCPTYCIDSDEYKNNKFLQEYKKVLFYIAAYGVNL